MAELSQSIKEKVERLTDLRPSYELAKARLASPAYLQSQADVVKAIESLLSIPDATFTSELALLTIGRIKQILAANRSDANLVMEYDSLALSVRRATT